MLNLLAACGIGTNTGPTPISKHAPPTPARPPKGTMLFEADWSHGLTGWQATAGWKVINGIFQLCHRVSGTNREGAIEQCRFWKLFDLGGRRARQRRV